MIYWRGSTTSGDKKWSCESETFEGLYNSLCLNGAIVSDEYDPLEKYVIELAGFDYDELVAEADTLSEDDGDFGKAWEELKSKYGISNSLTDEQYMEMIRQEDGNAYYQSFSSKKFEDCALKFDKNGMLI